MREYILSTLKKLGIKPNKTLGQNFLISEKAYRAIIEAMELKEGDTVLEIGPGLGTLTQYLEKAGANIIAVEKDDNLSSYLQKLFQNNSKIEIVNEDILKFNPKEHNLESGEYYLVGNLPYYLTSHLIRSVLGTWPLPKSMVFMVQKEVAEKITATPPEMSLLSILIQFYATTKRIMKVSSGSFYPSPDVDSAIIKLVPKPNLPIEKDEEKAFFELIFAGFKQKRRQLLNNISTGFKMTKEATETLLLASDIDFKRRPETLSLEEWVSIYRNLKSYKQ